MQLTRWNPYHELEEMNDRLNRAFGRPVVRAETGKEMLTAPDWTPTVDIIENPEEYILKVEIPEVKKDDVKVSVDNGILRIQGERNQEKEEKGKKFHRVERLYGSFLRTFTMPENVEEGNVRAEFKDGVLNVRLMKSEKAKPKAIEVKVS